MFVNIHPKTNLKKLYTYIYIGAWGIVCRAFDGSDGNVPRACTQCSWRSGWYHYEKCPQHLHLLVQCIVDILHKLRHTIRSRHLWDRARPDGGTTQIAAETSAAWSWQCHVRCLTQFTIDSLILICINIYIQYVSSINRLRSRMSDNWIMPHSRV